MIMKNVLKGVVKAVTSGTGKTIIVEGIVVPIVAITTEILAMLVYNATAKKRASKKKQTIINGEAKVVNEEVVNED